MDQSSEGGPSGREFEQSRVPSLVGGVATLGERGEGGMRPAQCTRSASLRRELERAGVGPYPPISERFFIPQEGTALNQQGDPHRSHL